jgi:DNA-binding GntR family transcriptional regulator
MLVPLAPSSLTAREAYLRLRHAIVNGELAPESRLTERELGDELGVARATLREALAMLEAEALVVATRDGGARVRRITPDEIWETYEVRALLEGKAARLAAERIGRSGLERLRRLDQEMRRALALGYPSDDDRIHSLATLNAEFHKTIACASGNGILARTLQTLIDTPLYARAYSWFTDAAKEASFAEHLRMIDLLGQGGGRASERFWSDHVERGRDYLIDHLAEASA